MFAFRKRLAFSTTRSARKSNHWSDQNIDRRVRSQRQILGSKQPCARRASSTYSLIRSIWRSWFAGGPQSPSPTDTGRLNPFKSSQPSRRVEIDSLRRYLGHPHTTVCKSELEPSSILFKIDPEHEVLSTWSFNSDGVLKIPGAPPKWSPRTLPVYLKATGQLPRATAYQPILSRIAQETHLADISTTPSILANLFKFCASRRPGQNAFVFSIQQNTLVMFGMRFKRQALSPGSPTELVNNSDLGNFGMAFERAFTRPEPGMSPDSRHIQFIRYTFGKLSILARCEVDAWRLPKGINESVESKHDWDKKVRLELKCIRRKEFRARIMSTMPQAWFSRTKQMEVGLHSGNGTITEVRRIRVRELREKWARTNQTELQKLHSLLCRLRVEASSSETGVCVGVFNQSAEDNTLEVFSMAKKHTRLYEDFGFLHRLEGEPTGDHESNLRLR
ncbi:hypothetical protein K505DRAFT_326128 [Melanomma pulvis-pyrius CBS 109.77]|uniref:Geranylgeranyl pyrophosphate synthetase n=1 Tax=Melanomma pulvis-pyrius CBS 109.77 TaxID=1314802 RepID=A0A6A6X7X0_9PLEO|nr:hypothetical protein K505DRAFT_326128 [Melanomma pulvis-pyrius CBS 109.77]